MEEIEQVESGTENSDVVEQSSSETPEPAQTEAAAKPAVQTKEPEIDWEKAFQHPRFKELNSQRNEAVEQAKAFKAQLDTLQQQFSQFRTPQAPSKEQTEHEALISEIKAKVDPRLAAILEASLNSQKELAALKDQQQNFSKQYQEAQRQAVVKESIAKINQLHETNKLDPAVREIINTKLDALYMQGKLSPQNLESEYTSTLANWNKFIEARDRALTEKYVADKKKDANVPASQPKGTPAKPAAKKFNWSKDPEIRNQQIAAQYLKAAKANKEADAV